MKKVIKVAGKLVKWYLIADVAMWAILGVSDWWAACEDGKPDSVAEWWEDKVKKNFTHKGKRSSERPGYIKVVHEYYKEEEDDGILGFGRNYIDR